MSIEQREKCSLRLQVHAALPVSLADGSSADDLGWERWSGPPAEKHGALFSSQAVAVRAPSALQVEVGFLKSTLSTLFDIDMGAAQAVPISIIATRQFMWQDNLVQVTHFIKLSLGRVHA